MMKKKGSFIPSLIVLRVFTSPYSSRSEVYKFVAHTVARFISIFQFLFPSKSLTTLESSKLVSIGGKAAS